MRLPWLGCALGILSGAVIFATVTVHALTARVDAWIDRAATLERNVTELTERVQVLTKRAAAAWPGVKEEAEDAAAKVGQAWRGRLRQ